MISRAKDLWSLHGQWKYIDPQDLTAALEAQVISGDLDYRTCLLIRDSVKALRGHWGEERLSKWLGASLQGAEIERICQGPWDCDRGFSGLMSRVVDLVPPGKITEYLRELGNRINEPSSLVVGGRAALILAGVAARGIKALPVVDEVPRPLRERPAVLEDAARRHGLRLTHFPRHYLASGWEARAQGLPPLGLLSVRIVDPYDIMIGLLPSDRTEDRIDVLELQYRLDKGHLTARLKNTFPRFEEAPHLRERADINWYVNYRESLPA